MMARECADIRVVTFGYRSSETHFLLLAVINELG
jgi:hypothetical protein